MTRGKQKIEAQRRNEEKNQKSKGSQFEARAVALKVSCPIYGDCKWCSNESCRGRRRVKSEAGVGWVRVDGSESARGQDSPSADLISFILIPTYSKAYLVFLEISVLPGSRANLGLRQLALPVDLKLLVGKNVDNNLVLFIRN
ncbi:hypothetical protein C3L33_07786, partial [Rhododendron williamsianum]